ncbi:MAG: hemolysin family protein [Anaerolineae bacterium]
MNSLSLALIFLFAFCIVSGMASTLLVLSRLQIREMLKQAGWLRLFDHVLAFFFKEKRWEGLFYSLSLTKHVLEWGYILTGFYFLIHIEPFSTGLSAFAADGEPLHIVWVFLAALIILGISLILESIFNLFSLKKTKLFLSLLLPIAFFFFCLCTPLTALFFKILYYFLPGIKTIKSESPSFRIRDKILDILHDSELRPYLDPNDQKLILSVASFKDRIAREVMVPRIDVFSLPADTTIEEAAQNFIAEGYSRIPVYRETIDHMIGVLLYKDILKIYTRQHQSSAAKLKESIESMLKPVLYTPETKKISHLLQEFRSKKIHLAIVVDEYGGTEGIVTIEDILEELVGEISDEYDIGEELLYSKLPSGGWVVDAKMTIVDIEEELGIKIPLNPDYDTIGGYIFHRAGSIPSKGWRIHHDDFDLEVLTSSERSIEKIRITPNK